jgi:hypothetical protein
MYTQEEYHPDMDFEPDIIVSEEGSPRRRMVVEAKLSLASLQQAESILKRYMLGMGVPLGLIVSPKRIVTYRYSFTSFSEDSIKLLGEFDVPRTLFPSNADRPPSRDTASSSEQGFVFQREVQAWLEELASTHVVRDFSPAAREALVEHVLPALVGGVVHAAGPRELKAS